MTDTAIPEPMARRILQQAIDEGRASEFLTCLFSGGSATVDAVTGKLVLVNFDFISQMGSS